MPSFSANLSLLFGEVDFPARFERAAAAGFRGVECHFPYDYRPETLRACLDRHALEQVLFNLPAGDWTAGERGIACLPGREAEFAAGLERAIAYAHALGCPRLNCLVGIPPPGLDPERAHETLIGNLRLAAERLAEAGIVLLVEPINTRDMPGFLISRSEAALALFEAAGHPNLALQYDIYHMQVMEDDLAMTLERLLPRIGHLQVADAPGRHEPGTGEIHYPFLFKHLDRLGYRGWVGAEYWPASTTEAGLGWLKACLPAGPRLMRLCSV